MTGDVAWFGVIGYGFAAVVYAVVAVLLVISQPSSRRSPAEVIAIAASVFWAAALTASSLYNASSTAMVVGLEAAYSLVWIFCTLSWLQGTQVKRALGISAGVAAAAAAILALGQGVERESYAALLIVSLLALLAVEQVIRNAREEQRASMRPLCGAAGAIAVANLFVYSQAALLGGLTPIFWEGRALLSVAVVPLVVVGIKRQAGWTRELFVSRQVVFYTASLLGVGGYLLAMGIVAYAIRVSGREWSILLEALFLTLAVIVLFTLLFSGSIRSRVRTFLIKHFYRNKYDYREEWLTLTHRLGQAGELRDSAARGLEALARIIGSKAGGLWIATDSGQYDRIASLGDNDAMGPSYASGSPVVEFLRTWSWVIDSREYDLFPDRYQTAFGDPRDGLLPPRSVIVPLDCQGYLQGFVVLARPSELGSLNFEDHDILKTAGKQVAVVLAQCVALERLAQTRQFEAMSKMSTFLMHDLKNILAQQQLVVSNAVRFRNRPEFVDDAIATIRSGVERMRYVLEQLKAPAANVSLRGRADLSKALMEVRSHCADREPIPSVACAPGVWVGMERERLVSVLTHLVRNAQDATPTDGSIKVEASVAGHEVLCAVSDTGSGMDALFIRDRLFRPFDSTKGAQGMGIGAYQAREMVRSAGGDIEVTSVLNVGTTFRLRLPLVAVERAAMAAPDA